MTVSNTSDIPSPASALSGGGSPAADNAVSDALAGGHPVRDVADDDAGVGGGWPRSPFACVDAAFAALTTGPDPLTLDLDRLGAGLGLPPGRVPLPLLRAWLGEHRRAWAARDAVWRELIRRARLDGPAWVVAATAMALPGLVIAAARLTANGWSGDPDDVDAEVLTGFLTALRDTVDATGPAPYAGLCQAGWRAGLALVRQQRAFLPVEDVDQTAAGSRTPPPPWGHPDLLVRRAVVLGLVDPGDEQPYIDIRLGRRAIEPIAADLGLPVDTLRRRLSRIDARITAALADGLLTGTPSLRARRELAAQATHRTRTRDARSCTATRVGRPDPQPAA